MYSLITAAKFSNFLSRDEFQGWGNKENCPLNSIKFISIHLHAGIVRARYLLTMSIVLRCSRNLNPFNTKTRVDMILVGASK